jgi:NAD(P)-dependent dehydrogenase (short-subunit alcohol dehydrogenase family)
LKKVKEGMMKSVIVVTGASSGFGALTARELAKAGHTVYAGMPDTRQRNAPQVEDARKFAADNKADLRTVEMDVQSQDSVDRSIETIVAASGRLDVVVDNAGHMVFGPVSPAGADVIEVALAVVRLVDMSFGTRPFRVHIDPADDGATVGNVVADRIRVEFLRNIGLADILKPTCGKHTGNGCTP